jgi:hypothetical protein
MNERKAERLLAAIERATAELRELLAEGQGAVEREERTVTTSYDELDRTRRRRPEWRRRGRVFYAISREGGRVSPGRFEQIVVDAGYDDLRGANGFFRGDPEPVLEREGEEILLTERGQHAARFYEAYWLPQETTRRAEGA